MKLSATFQISQDSASSPGRASSSPPHDFYATVQKKLHVPSCIRVVRRRCRTLDAALDCRLAPGSRSCVRLRGGLSGRSDPSPVIASYGPPSSRTAINIPSRSLRSALSPALWQSPSCRWRYNALASGATIGLGHDPAPRFVLRPSGVSHPRSAIRNRLNTTRGFGRPSPFDLRVAHRSGQLDLCPGRRFFWALPSKRRRHFGLQARAAENEGCRIIFSHTAPASQALSCETVIPAQRGN